MIKHFPYQQLGKADHGWLKANHHFSFANYYNPKRMGFGALRVINDDWIAPGTGFPTHPHKNMEIITFVRSGAINHEDSEGNKGITNEGEVQVMSAGKGIAHSEYNLTNQPLTLYQIWIESNVHDIEPRWDSKPLFLEANNKGLSLLVSGYKEDKNDTLFINQEARIFGGKIIKGTVFEHNITHQAYVLASKGCFEIIEGTNTSVLNKGDGAEITKTSNITFKVIEDSEILLIDIAAQ